MDTRRLSKIRKNRNVADIEVFTGSKFEIIEISWKKAKIFYLPKKFTVK